MDQFERPDLVVTDIEIIMGTIHSILLIYYSGYGYSYVYLDTSLDVFKAVILLGRLRTQTARTSIRDNLEEYLGKKIR
jgi:hypothetical protein